MNTRQAVLALAATSALALGACSGASDAASGSGGPTGSPSSAAAGPGDRLTVVTDMYPTTYAVQAVAGDSVDVIQLAPAGVEPHEYELMAKQVQQIADADLVAYLPGMIPAVAEAVEQEAPGRAVDVSAGVELLAARHEEEDEHAEGEEHEHEDGDPHIWLAPANMAAMGRTVADALNAAGVPADASALQAQMSGLEQEMKAKLSACAIDTIVVSHKAFGYLADTFGFTQVGISGLAPEAEPSAGTMAAIADLVRDKGITTVYHESLLSPAAAETIAAETGAKTALLDPIEGNTDDAGYPAIMRANAEALHAGQGCS